ncbi:MAG: glutamate-5-semialdehyde dehydrogenase [Bacillota bacterium]|nr:glutamate-5-semialdehyde dehydrogenase [Bacillota bacterium]
MTTLEIMQNAKAACPSLAKATTEQKNNALLSMADMLLKHTNEILEANKADVQSAKGTISDVMIDRLTLTESRIGDMAEGIRQVALLNDPVWKVQKQVTNQNGILIEKVSVPMGVVAIIYESRPNVTSDAAVLAIKAGNACILRGGKEAFRSSNEIVKALKEGLEKAGLSEDLVNLIQDTTRQSAKELMEGVGYIDLLIPRGGAGLIRACTENAKVPCIQTGTGICHLFVDENANQNMALEIIENAKTSRPSVCNALEVCLVHKNIKDKFLPKLYDKLVTKREQEGKIPVELRLDETAQKIIPGTKAGKDDFDTEFLDYILAVKIVDGIDEAIEHISVHSTGHSDAIITENKELADQFTKSVDSAAVYVNASTRFTDGGVFGLGCEMGISTQKLHARGPIGLEELTTTKYIIHGNGQIR